MAYQAATCPFRSIPREDALSNHKFKIGQSVNYKSGPIGAGRGSGVYKITQLLPPEGDDLQYKIKSAAEPHERVVKESQLNRAA
jgi:hypothetical protein